MEFDQFVDQLVAEKGLDQEDPEIVAQIKQDISERIENRVNALILSELNPEDMDSFEAVIDGGSEQEVQKFIQEHIPDFNDKVAAELLTFRSAYLG